MRVATILQTLALTAFVSLLPVGVVFADGAPELTLKEQWVAAGGTVTVSGDALGGKGDTVTLTLKGARFQATLGTVTLDGDLFENKTFTIPKDAPAGTYVIVASNGSISAQAQLQIAGTSAANESTPTQQEPAVAARPWTPVEWAGGVALVVLTGGLAVVLLWRSRDDLTVIR